LTNHNKRAFGEGNDEYLPRGGVIQRVPPVIFGWRTLRRYKRISCGRLRVGRSTLNEETCMYSCIIL